MKLVLLIAAATAALFLATSAAAAPPEHFSFQLDPETIVHQPCGAVETVLTTVSGAEYFDKDGNSVKIQLHFRYQGTIVGPDGQVYRNDASLNVIFTPEGINALNGQGLHFRLRGLGVVFKDVGHLVFSDITGETLKSSAKVIRFDDPNAPDFSAALCAAIS